MYIYIVYVYSAISVASPLEYASPPAQYGIILSSRTPNSSRGAIQMNNKNRNDNA